jgi:hypothetical protein
MNLVMLVCDQRLSPADSSSRILCSLINRYFARNENQSLIMPGLDT